MLIKDIVYLKITTSLQALNYDVDSYIDSLDDQESQEATDLSEYYSTIDACIEKIETAYNNVPISPCLPSIKSDIDFELPLFQEKLSKLSFLLDLSIEVEKDVECLELEVSLNLDDFKISEYKGYELPFPGFAYYNSSQEIDSLAYLNLDSYKSNKMDDYGFNRELLVLLISKYYSDSDGFSSRNIIVHRSDVTEGKHIFSALKALAILKGLVIHKSKVSTITSSVDKYCDEVSCTKPYSQFLETIIILSEANERKDILGKYLNIYHVIESFMHKVPLVGLSGAPGDFKIRGFKNLYREIDRSERESINRLFNKPRPGDSKYWELDLGSQFGSITFENFIKRKLVDLGNDPRYDEQSLNDLFYNLGVTNASGALAVDGFTKFKQNPSAKRYVDIIYLIRCSIVHNKETEYHISNYTLDDCIVSFIDYLLIEPLTVLIGKLICDEQTNVWYKNKGLELYS